MSADALSFSIPSTLEINLILRQLNCKQSQLEDNSIKNKQGIHQIKPRPCHTDLRLLAITTRLLFFTEGTPFSADRAIFLATRRGSLFLASVRCRLQSQLGGSPPSSTDTAATVSVSSSSFLGCGLLCPLPLCLFGFSAAASVTLIIGFLRLLSDCCSLFEGETEKTEETPFSADRAIIPVPRRGSLFLAAARHRLRSQLGGSPSGSTDTAAVVSASSSALFPSTLNSAAPPLHLPSLFVTKRFESETFISKPSIQLDLHQQTIAATASLGRRISHPRAASCCVKPQLLFSRQKKALAQLSVLLFFDNIYIFLFSLHSRHIYI
ncbi:hypothetical protein M9H77_08557 [Catharanthus roseus]|uniref:Uncharacterized protein n=1 Tax=Catharanthus roseus TaxID=4058 RepID=A0ACC0BYC8_CATRO|nr:hypothetical protein M9H77_08557 [Catharanthus roseus]